MLMAPKIYLRHNNIVVDVSVRPVIVVIMRSSLPIGLYIVLSLSVRPSVDLSYRPAHLTQKRTV